MNPQYIRWLPILVVLQVLRDARYGETYYIGRYLTTIFHKHVKYALFIAHLDMEVFISSPISLPYFRVSLFLVHPAPWGFLSE